MIEVYLEETGSRRRVAETELPLVLGGPDPDIRVSGMDDRRPLAYFGVEGDELFIQPAPEAGAVLCNETRLETSQWLHDGDAVRAGSTRVLISRREDELCLRVERRLGRVATEPPVLVAVDPGTPVEGDPKSLTVKPIEFAPRPTTVARRRRLLHPVGLLIWGVIIALGVTTWLIFSARSVEIRVEPQPDRLSVEGALLGVKLGGNHLLRPGSYRVVAEKEGYRPLAVPLSVSRQPTQVFEFALEKLPGSLVIETVPEDGVAIAVDGTEMGVTPVGPLELSEGEHVVSARAEGYEPAKAEVVIEGAGSVTTLSLELVARWAAVSFGSNPPGAAVTLDGELIGRTPLTDEVLEGTHTFELRLPGYKVHRSSFEVVAGSSLSLPVAALDPLDGRLLLSSEPAGAAVRVDGEYRGQTPLELEMRPGTEHRLSVAKLGHQTVEKSIRLGSEETLELHLALDARFGDIEVIGFPPDAELIVDGQSRGGANQKLRLPSVAHEIEVRKPGYETFRQTVTPRPGFPQRIQATLRTEQEAREASRAAVVHGPQGQELRLIEPGRLRMGASRREPGRRANETLRDVVLTRAFYLAARETSNREFREFREQHRSGLAGPHSLDNDDHPVVRVTWAEATRYCNWLSMKESLPPAYGERDGRMVGVRPMSNGYRLPTEAEWAWAARSSGEGAARRYPWGESLPVEPGSGNYADAAAAGLLDATLSGYNDSFAVTAPVDSFEPNSAGIFNLGGNVAEWVHDLYAISPSGSATVEQDPLGPDEGEYHVIRGSSWMDSTITELRLSFRDYGDQPRPDVGFRIARYAD